MDKYIKIVNKILDLKYPKCDGALMAGSIVRGEGTKTSDIDLIIFDMSIDKPYRESFMFDDVPIEVFVQNKESFKFFFEDDCKRKMPSLPKMVVESLIIKDNDYFIELKDEKTRQED